MAKKLKKEVVEVEDASYEIVEDTQYDNVYSPQVTGIDPKLVKVTEEDKGKLINIEILPYFRAETTNVSGLQVTKYDGQFMIGDKVYDGKEMAIVRYDNHFFPIPLATLGLLLKVYDN